MDVLAEVLSTTRVGATIYGRVTLRAPFAMRFDRRNKAGFHVVQQGSCWLSPPKGPPLALQQGDVVMLPRGWDHTISDRPRASGVPYAEVVAQQARRSEGPPSAVLLCGAYAFDDDAPHPLLGILPPILHAPGQGVAPSSAVRVVAELLSSEIGSGAPGSETAARRLLDVLFLYALRDWLSKQPEGSAGWLGALADPPTQRALAALHSAPARDWSLEGLARNVGVSRATLARRFSQRVGEPPLSYLRRWRMALAAQALRERDLSLGQLAESVGYTSEVAFHKAFTRDRGVTPAEYRRAHRA